MNKIIKCPTCAKEISWSKEEKWRPFCCERCKLIDFGEWVSENHRIKGKPAFTAEEQPTTDD